MGLDPKNLPQSILRAMHREPVFQPIVREPVKPKKPSGLSKPRGRRKMNGVERDYMVILEAEKRLGKWKRYDWEGITLRWPDGMTCTPDFVALKGNEVWLIETKGPWIEEDAKVKFRAARAYWPEFCFMMMQQDKYKNWTQIL